MPRYDVALVQTVEADNIYEATQKFIQFVEESQGDYESLQYEVLDLVTEEISTVTFD